MSASPPAAVHPLAIASLGASLLAYASSFVGTFALVLPALLLAVVAIVCGHLARRAIRQAPRLHGGAAVALLGLVSGYAYVMLGTSLLMLFHGATAVPETVPGAGG